MIRFFLVLAIILSYTGFKAIQLSPHHPYQMLSLAGIFLLTIIASQLATRAKPLHFDRLWFMFLSWVGSLFMGFWSIFILLSIPVDILHGGSFLIFKKSFLNQGSYLIIFGVSLLIVLLGFLEVLRGPQVKIVDIPVEAIPSTLSGFKIAQISDLHIGPTIQSRYVNNVVEKTNATSPDIVFITGDLVDFQTAAIKKHLMPLQNLKSKYGTYYVTGNHEYYWDVNNLLPELKKLGMNILLNEHKIIDHLGSKILLAGLTDHQPDLKKATFGADLKAQLNILLVHRPDPFDQADKAGFQLQFSGHTHAGQFFPFSLLIPIAHKYYKGLNKHGKLWLYVNPGTGYWGPANRFGIKSEITLVKLS